MGSYYSHGGYANPTELEEAMHLCELQQFVYFKNFLSKVSPKIIKPIREKNWAMIAEIYNGPGYRDGAYDVKMRDTYNKYIALKNK
ncbi:N-acetylmuramidase family protein [Aggregatibacter actinomycetemcomitans]|uniref:N-acetylmuramidase domain-containing protein n=1 Tax=Aggregatibacter actinomycetemcomitans TaxID=714 RepID=UPI0011D91550|nr:N-acetylmuramidase domain-containing protein [Aggregatibacter actinomycetemcomitans]QEH46209.1 N-acetylmuramidase family protein [Aggregatibacter actinomycetemcomitans]QEH48257.1 N-acetylmuramidase family protein [Aggregatibacter actinomycetemcomitans]QEH50250.1 N-acetylmuramidase family protein [Aggregatibacter actinomycetemcomitans]TYA50292.1 N-acetylmuramidase family protein [Aggregatibacter actinomycetemcomitans]TYB26798.1 N-acetylmuramidase family protein [Aggregatibacter actinomycetem